ncbi:levanase-like [Phymastichus coffea]|uniref:levanase-like n=1 Tax=Phymastichus coffea TaxID=108790 RepID=UPI00273BB66A|nr:levanase-like [Phymastichus coffea]
MSCSIIQLLFCCACILLFANGQSYKEKYRLQVHFSLPKGWANDPNGLIYVDGYYHLYYQNNPASTIVGPVHWGHARSKDLMHWENLPIALKPDGKKQIFSGCCILAKRNLIGLAADVGIAKDKQSNILLAIYTHHDDVAETQAMSYSFDNGTTWTQYSGNPIIKNPGSPDFRDPNIIERNGIFYMALAVNDRISFYSSTNLKSWKYLSSFGIQPIEGDHSGVWECPSIISLKDEQGKKHDILIVSLNPSSRGSAMQYFVGAFDGVQFKSYGKSGVLWLDNGFDNYAAIPYHNDPHDRAVIIGWMSNWMYAANIPTSTWRGQFTIPRELSLKTVNGVLHVSQRPVDELNKLIDPLRTWSLRKPIDLGGKQTIDLTQQIPFKTGSLLKMEYVLDIGCAKSGKVSLQFGNDLGEFVSFNFDITKGIYELDRSKSGNVSFHHRFAETARANRISTSKLLSGLVILDVASIEILADDGLNSFTNLFFPNKPFENIKIISNVENTSKCIKIQKINVAVLRSIWK